MYTILVGPPGVGKTFVTSKIDYFWAGLKEHKLAPTSLTKAALIDELVGAQRKVVRPGMTPPFLEFNSLLIVSNELGTMLSSYDLEFMSTMTDLYDCKRYAEARRTTKTRHEIPAPQINWLCATTPSFLADTLPPGAWDQGFISRTILVYSGQRIITSPFAVHNGRVEKEDALKADLKRIGALTGEIFFTDETRDLIVAWNKGGMKPAPTSPRIQNYNTRRLAHFLKLMMVASTARSDDLVITVDDFQSAMNWLLEMEAHLPSIFKAMSTGGESKVMLECQHMVLELQAKTGAGVREGLVTAFLKTKLPPHAIMQTINIMVSAEMLLREIIPGVGIIYKAGPVTDV